MYFQGEGPNNALTQIVAFGSSNFAALGSVILSRAEAMACQTALIAWVGVVDGWVGDSDAQ